MRSDQVHPQATFCSIFPVPLFEPDGVAGQCLGESRFLGVERGKV